MRIVRFLCVFVLGALLVCGQGGTQTYPFQTNTPPPVVTAGAFVVGTPGVQSYYYWVVARYPVGYAQPPFPAVVVNAPNTLSGSNYVTVSWPVPASAATGYDVLRTTTGQFPGSCTCAVALNTASTTANDQGGALSAYTFTPANTAIAYLQQNNRDFASPAVLLLDSAYNHTLELVQGGGNGLQITAGAVGSSPVKIGSNVSGAAANAGMQIVTAGAGAVTFLAGGGTGTNFAVVGATNSVDYLNATGNSTINAAIGPVLGVGGTDANVGLTLSPAGTGTVNIRSVTAVNGVSIDPAPTGSSAVITSASPGADANANLIISTNGTGILKLQPGSDSTTAINLARANGTGILIVDTTNQRVGIGATPGATFDIFGKLWATSAGVLTKYNNLALSNNGLASEVATVALTAQGASISATNFTGSPFASGLYRGSCYAVVTTAATTSSSILCTLGWTDAAAETASSAAQAGNTVGAFSQQIVFFHTTGSNNITYATTYASSGATAMLYSLYGTVEAL